jgi:hypothetical protein
MPVLQNSKHEQFAVNVSKGLSAARAYTSVYGEAEGARQSAYRLLRNTQVSARVAELTTELSADLVAAEISDRNTRIQALQERWTRLRANLNQVLEERGAEMVGVVPGGSTGLLMRDYKGASTPVYRLDPGVVALLAELRAHEKQAAEELGQWVEKREETSTLDSVAILNEGRQRIAEMRRKQLAEGGPLEVNGVGIWEVIEY